ncbi:MAG: DUF1987 domain-containing protein [Flavobacteriales bacterium]|nr:DUF1987 domain-containing protein [Flavobacteriales bacterium]
MESLHIEATEFTPMVIMDPSTNSFEITGESRPENAGAFYQEILSWLDNYYNLRYWKDSKFSDVDAVFEFRLEYFNSTSAKFLLDIFMKLATFRKDDINIKVNWHYDEPDIDMKESGEEFAEMTGLPFEYIAI